MTSASHRSTPAPTRRVRSYNIRTSAATLAAKRPHPTHRPNNDENHYRYHGHLLYVSSFTKGLPHDPHTGLLVSSSIYPLFVRAVNSGDPSDIRAIPLGPPDFHPRSSTSSSRTAASKHRLFRSGISRSPAVSVRAWESMAAGLTFDLQGPDAHSVTMPPCPRLDSQEFFVEVAELYAMALSRDVPFTNFHHSSTIRNITHSLNRMPWLRSASRSVSSMSASQVRRLRHPFTHSTIFRGDTPGDNVGPYISQFLLMGTRGVDGSESIRNGIVHFGAVRIDQRVRVAQPLDYMTSWESWLDVQNGADLRGRGSFESGQYRFITTPRDLATYVHFDALYQAYLNACIILLQLNAPFDPQLPFVGDDSVDKQQGFATFGGPHILTLVTEVATRALKPVRFQKYNIHRRLRPEAVGGLLERYVNSDPNDSENPFSCVAPLYNALDREMLEKVEEMNETYNSTVTDRGWPRSMDWNPAGKDIMKSLLLPMAYPEGSPMHPSYGAGHATVAGACVTILKAFFDHRWKLPVAFAPTADGKELKDVRGECSLTVEGELNKLCSNISIGRNWAGVHYYSDYRESIVLGETVALCLLEEQKLTYSEDFSMTVPLFDGSTCKI